MFIWREMLRPSRAVRWSRGGFAAALIWIVLAAGLGASHAAAAILFDRRIDFPASGESIVGAGNLAGDLRAEIIYQTMNGLAIKRQAASDSLILVSYLSGFAQIGSLTVAQTDDDTIPDIVGIGNYGRAEVWRGLGSGAFGAPTEISNPTGGYQVKAIVVGDANNDSHPDLITSLGVALGRGDGTFANIVQFPWHPNSSSVAAADFDGDNVLDAVYGAGDAFRFEHGMGDGTFAAPVEFAQCASTLKLVAADMNGDGFMDVVSAGSSLGVALGHGDGTFSTSICTPTGLNTRGLIVTDLDNDGILDAATCQYDPGSLLVFRGTGNGSLVAVGTFSTNFAEDIATGDTNGDGLPEVITASGAPQIISVFMNTSASTDARDGTPPAPDRAGLNASVSVDGHGRLLARLHLARTAEVRAEVFTAAGARIATLVFGSVAVGDQVLHGHLAQDSGAPLPSGVYQVRLTAGTADARTRFVVLR